MAVFLYYTSIKLLAALPRLFYMQTWASWITGMAETGGAEMTREEAIQCLENMKKRSVRLKNSPSKRGYSEHTAEEEALDLAIKSIRPCGKWVRAHDLSRHVECSECGYSIYACPLPGEKEHYYNFCPECGAIMAEEVQE